MMHSAELVQHVYEEIAEHYQQSGDGEQRDIFLLLAADAAFNAGYPDLAEQLRLRLLSLNPHHILRPYTSFAEALQSPDIQLYIEDLLRRHPPEQAPQLLEDLKERQHVTASRDLLFAEFDVPLEASDLRVFPLTPFPTPPSGEREDVTGHAQPLPAAPPPSPLPLSPWGKGERSEGDRETRGAKEPDAPPVSRSASLSPRPSPLVSQLPVSLAPPAPWLRAETETDPAPDAAADAPDLLDKLIACALFVLACLIAAALFGVTIILPLLK